MIFMWVIFSHTWCFVLLKMKKKNDNKEICLLAKVYLFNS